MALAHLHCCAILTIIHRLHFSPSQTETLSPLNTNSPFLLLTTLPHWPLASTTALSDSMNLTILGTLYKWNQTVYVRPIPGSFPTIPEVLKARMLTWFAIPFSTGSPFVRTLHHDLSILGVHLGCPYRAWLIISLSNMKL